MPPFRTLKAWQHAQALANECARTARRFPPEDRHILADQLVRAAYSVALNIAEGTARKGSREFRRFLDTAWGSLAEVQTALELARDQGYLSDLDFGQLDARATETAKTLWGLLRKVTDTVNRHASH